MARPSFCRTWRSMYSNFWRSALGGTEWLNRWEMATRATQQKDATQKIRLFQTERSFKKHLKLEKRNMKYERRKSSNIIALKESLTPKNWWCSNTKHGNQIGSFFGGVVRILSYRQWVLGGLSKWKNKDGFTFSLLKLWHSTEITKKWRSKKSRGLLLRQRWMFIMVKRSFWKCWKTKCVIVALLSYLLRDTPPNIPLSYETL